MKRTLAALALTGLMLGANVAVAGWNDFTLEPFWNHANEATSVVAAESTQQAAVTQSRKYDQVDNYNN